MDKKVYIDLSQQEVQDIINAYEKDIEKFDKQQQVLDKIKERHWKTRRNYVEDLIKLYDKLSELLEEIE